MAEETIPGVELFVKASTLDCQSLGADIQCHRIMMMFALKGLPIKTFNVDTIKKTNVQLHFPYKNFPTLTLDNGAEVLDDLDEIERRFEKLSETNQSIPKLACTNKDILSFVNVGPGSKIYQKFNYFIKNRAQEGEEALKTQLLQELKKVNAFLMSAKMPKDGEGNQMFLSGESPGLPDCTLLPKLHYIYVCLGVVKEFPMEELTGIESYLESGRKHSAFQSTCPKKADIVHFYCRQAGMDDAEAMRKSNQVRE
ncbi:predicted protein [Nematostella vectensis]|uniref:CLIC N-terminal domain-containing protein n=1 Tax=Nematostella vectensis TaxID=45351 RepID=A7S5C0_NEMVE|nr:chloride intracellular channel protein 3 [Nematostella vectensis]EDO41092.1 predicted protein [Nematostella vectensis]|eukprot:XP_001633155.1 predicted protein [Nematostella vectensis]